MDSAFASLAAQTGIGQDFPGAAWQIARADQAVRFHSHWVILSVMTMLRRQPLNSDSASVEWMEVAHEDDDVPIIGWAL
jgi:hypothetical protein